MECNKDDANRAKEIAERRFLAKDIVGAKKFALKAYNLYPGLDGIAHMLATLDVYISAETRVNGESDWYGILGVNPKADDEAVRKQFRKLALMLHPDKNKSIGGEGAFKYISEAWSLLSDKAKRMEYDMRKAYTTFPRVPIPNGKTANSNMKSHKNTSRATQPSPPAHPCQNPPRANTFWTVCHGCKMQYQYLRVYLNHNLVCPNCHQPFRAVETAPPLSSGSKPPKAWNCNQEHQKSNRAVPPNGGSSGFEKVKRQREEAQAAMKREEALRRKQASKRTSSNSSSGNSDPAKRRRVDDAVGTNQIGIRAVGAGFANLSGSKIDNSESVRVNGISKAYRTRDLSQLEVQDLLIAKARKEVKKKLHEWSSASMAKTSYKDKDKSDQKILAADATNSVLDADKGAEILEPMSINVPDPDFHDFDKDRMEKSFEVNQVWSAYDNDDGMPRYYAMIHNVISSNPFKIRISWLNSKTNTELGLLDWVGSGFSKTCGDFRIGKHEISSSLNSFSHKVRWVKGPRGLIGIYPRKGDVWAVYRNWSPDWNELTSDEVIHKYDMVEVLEDYNEELGVTVTPLVKVAGFQTVFHRHLDPREAKTIPREEMFRFSHHVPSYLLTGQEAPNAPKGCRELDPAATPPELLQVITDVKGDDIMNNVEKTTKKEENNSSKDNIEIEDNEATEDV